MSQDGAGEISIYGGAGGQRAVTEDLEHAAAGLRRAANDLKDARNALRHAVHSCEDAHPRALPEVAPYVYDAQEAARDTLHGPTGVTGLAEEFEDVARRLHKVGLAFLAAEQAAHQRLTALDALDRAVGDMSAAGAWVGRTGGGIAARRMGWDELGESIDPEYALPTTGVLNRTSVEVHLAALQAAGIYAPVRLALLAAARIAEVMQGEARLVDVDSRTASRPDPITSLADLGNLLEELNAIYPREVTVDQVVGPHGEVSWIVTIPGTADFVSADGEVIDVVSDLQMQPGGMSDATDLVLAAMAEAGVGTDDPVLLAGHSAGGMIASVLAASDDSPYDVKAVVTIGSPVGDIPHVPGVASLHVENEADLVPALDGRRNPDLPNVTTAVFDSRMSSDPERAASSRTIMGAHEPAVYTTAMAALDRDKSASMRAWRESTAGFFDSDATVERTVVSQVHGPAPSPEMREPRPRSQQEPRAPSFGLPRLSLGGIPELRP